MTEVVSSWASFGGVQSIYKHTSAELGCEMKFAVFIPGGEAKSHVLYYLSGLTCNEQNCIQKGNVQEPASRHNLIVVCPDTSPRGLEIEGEEDNWDFGTGAGFYVDATVEKWKQYRMYSYVTKELPQVVAKLLGNRLSGKSAITGHSMGGHGALVCALRNPGMYASVSAFAPICAPIKCPWGEKCFGGYLGEDRTQWEQYDGSVLAAKYTGPKINILVDQGAADNFLGQDQLLPDQLVQAAAKNEHVALDYHLRPDYDHSYFFIASFMSAHIDFHVKHLN